MSPEQVVEKLSPGLVQDMAELVIRDRGLTGLDIALLGAYFKTGPRPVIIARVVSDSVVVKESLG